VVGNSLKGLAGGPRYSQSSPLPHGVPSAIEFYNIALDEIMIGNIQVIPGYCGCIRWLKFFRLSLSKHQILDIQQNVVVVLLSDIHCDGMSFERRSPLWVSSFVVGMDFAGPDLPAPTRNRRKNATFG
jgi:hypothetical protein